MRKKIAAAACAALITGLGAGSALAGEVQGPPGSPGHPGTNTTPIEDPGVAHSACAFSGLNDFQPQQGQFDRITQNYGTNIQLDLDPSIFGFPGTDCRGN